MYPNPRFSTLLLLAIVINSAIARFLLVNIADRNKNEIRKGRLILSNIGSIDLIILIPYISVHLINSFRWNRTSASFGGSLLEAPKDGCSAQINDAPNVDGSSDLNKR